MVLKLAMDKIGGFKVSYQHFNVTLTKDNEVC